ncbi:hypothetical protein C7974DRAFT_440410 [Boeremia exigua]|uniref:uncharacterized protein n=1 Tax=Boeremia exigua TaxID=749465 RepID=UPI001E8EBE83|nr:uncharacterized protein C7974DRAFT_440410 [Boeremia exigua]KAH6644817.1 hypothetical protein C7974DRAFT_440410 [Boeremia exigua]
MCPCLRKKCTRGEKEEEKKKKKDKKCKLFGCGCGWMGLPIGGDCGDVDLNIPLPIILPGGLFGPDPCKLVGGCPKATPTPPINPTPPNDNNPPDVTPPPPPPVNDDDNWGEEGCGILGCDGYCNVEGGCDWCPPEICGGPKCTRPGGCGPRTGPNPKPKQTPKPECEEKDKTTVTERIVSCFENLKVEPTTIASISFTMTETVTSACVSFEATFSGCGLVGFTSTTTSSSITSSSSSEGPVCTRAPLDLLNDEGDNEQPSPTTDGPACSRTPLVLDNDEGDNEHPTSTPGPSCTRAPLSLDDDEGDNEQPTSSEAPACTRAPLSLDDDEGNNEVPSNSSISTSIPTQTSNSSSISLTATFASITSSTSLVSSTSTSSVWATPTGAPNCPTCDLVFATCIKESCKPDGSDAVVCAKFCLSALCYGADSAPYCKRGPCKPAACPTVNPTNFFSGEPAIPFTTVLSLPSTTMTITAIPSLTMSYAPTPTCNAGHTIDPHGKWTALVEHGIQRNPANATLSWTLWDEHGCKAGEGQCWNQFLGFNISCDIGAPTRTPDYRMGYVLHTSVTDSLNALDSEIEFLISKPVDHCSEWCWVKWKTNARADGKSWQISDDCARQCSSPQLTATDVSCDDGINKWYDPGDTAIQKRGGYCTWRMPFSPANDDPPPPPAPWTRESRWTIEFTQVMEYKTSSIEWVLKDPNGDKAGHLWKDTSDSERAMSLIYANDRGDRPDLQMRYKVLLTVYQGRKKEDTQVRLTYGVMKNLGCKHTGDVDFTLEPGHCQPYYETESDDEKKQSRFENCYCPNPVMKDNVEFSCEKVFDKFYPKDAGFERKFKCWWPHDLMDPYGHSGGDLAGVDAQGLEGFMGISGGRNVSWANATSWSNVTSWANLTSP